MRGEKLVMELDDITRAIVDASMSQVGDDAGLGAGSSIDKPAFALLNLF